MTFKTAGEDLIRRLERGVYESAKDVMRVSLEECPISGPETYGGYYRTIRGKKVRFEEPIYMEGDNGTLRRSARVFPPDRTTNRISVTVGYGFGEEVNPAGRLAAEYALPVHERSELRHHPPTKSHFLLDPLLAYAAHYSASLAASARESGIAGEALREVSGAELQPGLVK